MRNVSNVRFAAVLTARREVLLLATDTAFTKGQVDKHGGCSPVVLAALAKLGCPKELDLRSACVRALAKLDFYVGERFLHVSIFEVEGCEFHEIGSTYVFDYFCNYEIRRFVEISSKFADIREKSKRFLFQDSHFDSA